MTVESRANTALHPTAWLAWLLCASAAMLLASNPLYLSLGFLVACAAFASVRDTPKGRALIPLVLLGITFAALSVPFNVLTGSSGPTVWMTVPEWRSPDWFGGVVLGGEVTAEAVVVALGRAITIATLVVLAAAFNASVDHFRLLRLAPPAFAQVALTLTIAVLVVPESVAQAHLVAEARRLRGYRARGLRALPALLLPTLQGALERSVQRAESLEARGFGGGTSSSSSLQALAGVAGLGLLAWGAFAYFYYGPGYLAGAAMTFGAALAIASIAQRGRRPNRLRADPWSAMDATVVCASLLSLATVLAMRASGTGDVTFVPYPEVTMPAFSAAGAAAFLLLLAPLVAELRSAEMREVVAA